jgi:1-acyl-sn-glycerol-3-phosphate acyltransferase
MSWVKEILGRLLALWGIIIFVPTMLVAFILIAVSGFWKEPQSTIIFQRIAKAWMQLFFLLSGLRIHIKGKQYFKKGETYIVICNHNSFMDIPLTTPFIPGANKTIAKTELAKIPVFGMIYKRGSVLVDRKSEESRKQSFISMKKVLDMGLHMCIYPEGTRNVSGKPLQPFHNGAFKLARETGRPILPAVIFNTAKVLPVGKLFFFWPVKIEMHFLEPVPPGKMTTEELKQKMFGIMEDYYARNK